MLINSENQKILDLKKIIIDVARQGWCPATGGNFSIKLADNIYSITASGIDKNNLKPEDFLIIDSSGKVILGDKKPSAETLLHTTLYSLDNSISAVLHVHTVANTVLSLNNNHDYLYFLGYEMQKALTGITTHEATVKLKIIENNQNMEELARVLIKEWKIKKLNYGFLVKGHGLYTWGNSLIEAKRHLEGIEFLLSCELQKRTISNYMRK